MILLYRNYQVKCWYSDIQWNPSIAVTVGEWHFGCYTEVAVVEGFHCIRAATVGEWHVGCYTEVAVVEG